MLTSGLQAMDGGIKKADVAPKVAADTVPGMEAAVAAGRETRINPTSYVEPIITPVKELTQEEKNELGLKKRGY